MPRKIYVPAPAKEKDEVHLNSVLEYEPYVEGDIGIAWSASGSLRGAPDLSGWIQPRGSGVLRDRAVWLPRPPKGAHWEIVIDNVGEHCLCLVQDKSGDC